jgi:hypothetical protein
VGDPGQAELAPKPAGLWNGCSLTARARTAGRGGSGVPEEIGLTLVALPSAFQPISSDLLGSAPPAPLGARLCHGRARTTVPAGVTRMLAASTYGRKGSSTRPTHGGAGDQKGAHHQRREAERMEHWGCYRPPKLPLAPQGAGSRGRRRGSSGPRRPRRLIWRFRGQTPLRVVEGSRGLSWRGWGLPAHALPPSPWPFGLLGVRPP